MNGHCLTSEELEVFINIKQLIPATYHPSTNSLAKRAMQILLKKQTQGLVASRLPEVLLQIFL